MPRIYQLSRTGLKILYKIRHHRGHGIHSPFVFNLINKVIEEKTPYSAYDKIKAHIGNYFYDNRPQLNKFNLLSFRLINYFDAKRILEIGSGNGVNTICLTAPSNLTKCICIETSPRKSALAQKVIANWERNIKLYTGRISDIREKQDCIFINLDNYNDLNEVFIEKLCDLSHENTFIVIKGIRTNKHHQALWKRIKNIESRTAVLDLFNIGIVFFDRKLYRWNYQISF